MSRRYLFLCPDARKASGGVAVIYDVVGVLNRAGYEAAILHQSPGAGYPDHQESPVTFYTHNCRKVGLAHVGRLFRAQEIVRMPLERLRGGRLSAIDLRATDIIVVPEYMMQYGIEGFPENEIGVFVQNPFSFMRAYVRAAEAGHNLRERVSFYIGVSDICFDQFDLLGIEGAYRLPVSMKPEEFPFEAQKERLITFMPRKRPDEAKQIVEALATRGKLGDYRLQALDKMPRQKISEWLQRSRFFISLHRHESIGFPAAEAMAAGCVVVGYTGLGGREYFTENTGFPVAEDDTAALVRALEAAVTEYEQNPTRLDALRRHASEVINARYSRQNFEASLLRIWERLTATKGTV